MIYSVFHRWQPTFPQCTCSLMSILLVAFLVFSPLFFEKAVSLSITILFTSYRSFLKHHCTLASAAILLYEGDVMVRTYKPVALELACVKYDDRGRQSTEENPQIRFRSTHNGRCDRDRRKVNPPTMIVEVDGAFGDPFASPTP